MTAETVTGGRRAGAGRAAWLGAAAAACLAAAAWLRQPSIGYVLILAGATIFAAIVARRFAPGSRRWPAAWTAIAGVMLAGAVWSQWERARIERDWPAVARARATRAEKLLGRQLNAAMTELDALALRALDVPADPDAAMAALRFVGSSGGERGVIVYEQGKPLAWGGRIRAGDETTRRFPKARGESRVTRTPFYTTIDAVAWRGSRTAVAMQVVDARPPADRLTRPLAALIAKRAGVDGFEIFDGRDPRGGPEVLFLLFDARAITPSRGEALVHERLRSIELGAAALGIMLVLMIVAVWRDTRSRPRRLIALGVALVAVALTPLASLSGRGPPFDPAVYFAPLGGPFTATAGSLGLTATLALLGLLTLLRAHRGVPHRGLATFVVLVIAGLGPFLLRDLARGVNPPASGVPISLWLVWEVPLFLAGVSLLLAGASAGRAALGGARGLMPYVAPSIAVVAALLGPVVWEAPGRWPGWYPALWVAAIGALALTRRTRALVLVASVVAACGAATLVWGAATRKRVATAEADIARLTRADETMGELAERFAARLAEGPPPASDADLLAAYVASDLAAGGYAVDLGAWRADGLLSGELLRTPGAPWPAEMAEAITAARATGISVVREGRTEASRVIVAAVPFANGSVAGAVVAPRTRLEPDDPSLVLLGISEPLGASPPYSISLTDADPAAIRPAGRWKREGNELHGDWIVSGGTRPQRAHVEIEMRPLDVLVQRGTLAVLLNLAIVGALWILSAIADGGFLRWLRHRRRGWARSYRARLTIALFGFFVIPALAFALWSWRRLGTEDLQGRALLARETLRLVTAAAPAARMGEAAERALPLMVFEDGALRQASSPVYLELAPLGRYLPPDIHLELDVADEVSGSRNERIGEADVLFGFRAATGPSGARAVYAAPAPTNEAAIDQRRRDLGVLVLFFTALGALAALWLSGVAARQLAEPIGRLRRAALAIAGGELEPVLAGEPPAEFAPVFSAFRRMAGDLASSREALEEAQRRTAAILRNVASGVIAVRGDAVVTLANPRADALLGQALPPGTRLDAAAPPELLTEVRDFLAADDAERGFDLAIGDQQLRGRLTRLTRGDAGAVITLDDVTELSRAQRVLAWGEMARQVAHEIKNPLTPIRLGVQHLRRARADRRVDFDTIFEQNVDRILAEIDRLDEIARAFSRYGTVPAERVSAEPTDVAAAVRDIIGLERMGVSDVRWETTGAEKPIMALARADELREVMLNLLENARHANAHIVRIALRRVEGRVIITVTDDGDGISADALPRIFDPQFSTRTSGSGLGLAVTRRVIEAWGGAIDVESTPGSGTTITVALRAAS